MSDDTQVVMAGYKKEENAERDGRKKSEMI
jgi:hypothetical protein